MIRLRCFLLLRPCWTVFLSILHAVLLLSKMRRPPNYCFGQVVFHRLLALLRAIVSGLDHSRDFLVRLHTRPYSVAVESTPTSTLSCPKCQADQPDGTTECVKCGIIFAKYRPLAPPPQELQNSSRWVSLAKEWLFDSDTSADSLTFAGRVVVFLLLLWWGRAFIFTPLE